MWIVYALFSVVVRTVYDPLSKIILDGTETIAATFCIFAVVMACMFPITVGALWKKRNTIVPTIQKRPTALYALIGSGLFNTVGFWFFYDALRGSDLSLVVPLRHMVPLFLLFWAGSALKEKINFSLVGAVMLVMFGVFLVHSENGFAFHHFDRASFFALASAACFAGAATCDRLGQDERFPNLGFVLFASGTIFIRVVGFGIAVLVTGGMDTVVYIFSDYFIYVLAAGMVGALAAFSVNKAYVTGEAVKVVTTLRLQIVLSILIGVYFFGEPGATMRLIGGVVLTAGVMLIGIQGAREKLKKSGKEKEAVRHEK